MFKIKIRINPTKVKAVPVIRNNKFEEINEKQIPWIKRPTKKIIPIIKDLVKSGCVVVMTSQCLFGRVNMHVYDKGIDLLDAGVIAGEDMLAETAFVKLAWLLGNYKKSEVKCLIGKNLRGEISPRTNVKTFDVE